MTGTPSTSTTPQPGHPHDPPRPHDVPSPPTPPRGEARRDAAGVPHVVAATEPDLLHTQGWVTARDRTWQLVSDRWRAHGTWAEAVHHLRAAGTEVAAPVAGAAAEWDRFAHRIGVRATAERSLAALTSETREWVEHYAEGVRDGLATVAAADVPELRALVGRDAGRVAGPEAVSSDADPLDWRSWDAADCLAVFWLQQVLFGDWPHQLWREHVTEQLGPEWVDRLAADPSAQTSGSNAIGVAEARSATGAPLLASDPHRLLEAPNVYQQVRLTVEPSGGSQGPGLDVAGLAFPGVPGVQHVGHAGSVAWCITNAMARTQQLVPLSSDDRAVTTPGTTLTECGATTGAASVTRLWGRPGDPGARAVRQAADLSPGLGFEALPRLLHARTAQDAMTAWDHWVEPANCVLLADVDSLWEGVAGRPLGLLDVARPEAAPATGPTPSGDGAGPSAWSTHQPWRRVEDVAVHANHRRDQTATWGEAFAPPHRADRIRELLGAEPPVTAEDLRRIQLDTRSQGLLNLLRLTGVVVGGVPDAPGRPGVLGAPDHPVARALADFDGHMDPESDLALLAWRWRTALARRVAALPALAPLHEDSSVTAAARAEFPTLFEPWLDVTARVGLGLESLAAALPEELRTCARQALDDVADHLPTPDRAADRWGAEHQAFGLHALGWPVPLGPVGGDVDCVAATSSVPGRTASTVRGPVCRAVLALADPGASRWAVPLGAHGVLDAPAARNQTEAWRTGELLPVFSQPDSAPPPPDLVFAPVVPEVDGPVIHAWATEHRGRFWGMGDYSVQDVVEVYAWLDASPHHHAWMVTHEGQPVALWQTYDPAHDPVGEGYEVRPGDVGMHLMVGPRRHGIAELPALVGAQGAAMVFADPDALRLVAEPDQRNTPAVQRLVQAGFTLGPVVDLGHKVAQFAFLERPPGGVLP